MLSERSMLLNGFSTIDSLPKLYDSTASKTVSAAFSHTNSANISIAPINATSEGASYLYLESVRNEKNPRDTQLNSVSFDTLKKVIMESSTSSTTATTVTTTSVGIKTKLNNNGAISSVNHVHSASAANIIKNERLSPSGILISSGSNGTIQSNLSRSPSATPLSTIRGISPNQQQPNSTSPVTLVPIQNLTTQSLLNSIQAAAVAAAASVATGNRHNSVSSVPLTTVSCTSTTVGQCNTSSQSSAEFSTRNYSDFMRSLAAKYQNSNPNDSVSTRRSAFFNNSSESNSVPSSVQPTVTAAGKNSICSENSKYVNISKSASSSTCTISSLVACKEDNAHETLLSIQTPSAPPHLINSTTGAQVDKIQNTHNQIAAAAAAAVSVTPFMTSLFSGLPFPPLIDMSSTQALITLARAARESELHNIICSAQKSKEKSANASASLRPTLNAALQQAAQFVSPFLLSAQIQTQSAPIQQHQSKSSSSPIQSSQSNANNNIKTLIAASATSIGNTIIVNDRSTPLDLSSQQPLPKRFKPSTTSPKPSSSPFNVDNMSASLIIRRTSTSSNTASTATSSPSPPASRYSIPRTPTTEAGAIVVTTSLDDTVANIAFNANTSATHSCSAQSTEMNTWSVDDVCDFVGAIDICAEYIHCFREQRIDGSGLPLLTEDHLVKMLGMKLGPALKLRSILSKKLGGPCPCVACLTQVQQMYAMQAAAAAVATSTNKSNNRNRIIIRTSSPTNSLAGNENIKDVSTNNYIHFEDRGHSLNGQRSTPTSIACQLLSESTNQICNYNNSKPINIVDNVKNANNESNVNTNSTVKYSENALESKSDAESAVLNNKENDNSS